MKKHMQILPDNTTTVFVITNAPPWGPPHNGELVRFFIPEKDILGPGKVCSSCSIVGSSGSVLTYKLGSKINEADCIIRFNRAPSKGFEEHVGSGTQIRLTDSQSWGFFDHFSETVLAPLRWYYHMGPYQPPIAFLKKVTYYLVFVRVSHLKVGMELISQLSITYVCYGYGYGFFHYHLKCLAWSKYTYWGSGLV